MTPYRVKRQRTPILLTRKARTILLLTMLFLGLFYAGWHYRNALVFYFSNTTKDFSQDQKLHALRNYQVLSTHPGLAVGFDVSQYQGDIDWERADTIDGRFPLDFVFIRATAGVDGVDKKFYENWIVSERTSLLRGAYHYYRPNENSVEQARNFIATVKLKKGDLPPVLDIEQVPDEQPMDSLRAGLRRWLNIVEKHYGMKPVIYTGESFYHDFLRDEFAGYDFWIANYNFFVESIDNEWTVWQFTEKAAIRGIEGPVDVNIFNGSRAEMEKLVKK